MNDLETIRKAGEISKPLSKPSTQGEHCVYASEPSFWEPDPWRFRD